MKTFLMTKRLTDEIIALLRTRVKKTPESQLKSKWQCITLSLFLTQFNMEADPGQHTMIKSVDHISSIRAL